MEGGGLFPPPPSSPSWIEFTYNTGNYQDVVHSIYVDEKVSLNLNTDIFCDPHHKEIRKHLTNGQNYRTPRSINFRKDFFEIDKALAASIEKKSTKNKIET